VETSDFRQQSERAGANLTDIKKPEGKDVLNGLFAGAKKARSIERGFTNMVHPGGQ